MRRAVIMLLHALDDSPWENEAKVINVLHAVSPNISKEIYMGINNMPVKEM